MFTHLYVADMQLRRNLGDTAKVEKTEDATDASTQRRAIS